MKEQFHGKMDPWVSEEVSAWVNVPGWVTVLKRVIRLNEPLHEYWHKQEILAQRSPLIGFIWVHLLSGRRGTHPSEPSLFIHLPSPQPCSSPPPTYDTNTALSHNGRDYHDNRNNGSAWDNRVCGTPGQLKYLRDCWVGKNKQLGVFLFWELLHLDVSYFLPRESLECCFIRQSLKTLHLEESDV